MDLATVIRERRSIRRYSRQTVNLSDIARIIDSGRWAPTAANLQAWEFQVTVDPRRTEAIKAVSPGMFKAPPALIVISADREKAALKGGAGGEGLALMDACFAAENMLLTAHDLGLGACVLRSFNQQAVASLFGNPDHVVPELLIAVGHLAGEAPRRPRRRRVADVTHFERWGSPMPPEALAEAGLAGEESAMDSPGAGARPGDDGSRERPATVPTVEGGEARGGPQGELLHHLCYLATSAKGLSWEPRDYGSFRLMDACGRLIQIMIRMGMGTPRLEKALDLIELSKLSVMDDKPRFDAMIDEVVGLLVDEVREAG